MTNINKVQHLIDDNWKLFYTLEPSLNPVGSCCSLWKVRSDLLYSCTSYASSYSGSPLFMTEFLSNKVQPNANLCGEFQLSTVQKSYHYSLFFLYKNPLWKGNFTVVKRQMLQNMSRTAPVTMVTPFSLLPHITIYFPA